MPAGGQVARLRILSRRLHKGKIDELKKELSWSAPYMINAVAAQSGNIIILYDGIVNKMNEGGRKRWKLQR